MDKTPFVVIVSVNLKPGTVERYFEIVQEVWDTMRYEKTFVNTVVHQSEDDPLHIMMYETWLDKADFLENQLKRPYRDEYERLLGPLLARPRELTYFKPLRGDFVFQNGPSQTVLK